MPSLARVTYVMRSLGIPTSFFSALNGELDYLGESLNCAKPIKYRVEFRPNPKNIEGNPYIFASLISQEHKRKFESSGGWAKLKNVTFVMKGLKRNRSRHWVTQLGALFPGLYQRGLLKIECPTSKYTSYPISEIEILTLVKFAPLRCLRSR